MTDVPQAAEPVAPEPAGAPRGRRFLLALPLLCFAALAALFAVRLGAGDPSRVPSALIGRPLPRFDLALLPGLATEGRPGLSDADLRGRPVTLLNVFASWCVECHTEHAALMALSRDPALLKAGVALVGVVYKDDAGKARRYLETKGNPFAQVGVDPAGRAGIDLGVYGVPETFVIDRQGTVVYKLVGGVSEATRPALLAAIERAGAALKAQPE